MLLLPAKTAASERYPYCAGDRVIYWRCRRDHLRLLFALRRAARDIPHVRADRI